MLPIYRRTNFLSYMINKEVFKKTNFFSCLSILEIPFCNAYLSKNMEVDIDT